ncbi:MAG: WYL domain-containing protein [Thiomicrorhabdus sp.]|nr:WYL domain-containing protein [Thiomicrorhabdus sp.]
MEKTERQRDIIQYMKNVHYKVHFDQLSDLYGCSQRNIRRDFTHLINEKNAPWYILNNHVHIDPTRKNAIELHGQWFDRQELEALFVLNQVIKQLAPGSLKNQLQPFDNKIHQLLQNETNNFNLGKFVRLIEIADRHVDTHTFQLITQALSEQKQLKIHFWNRETNKTQERTISPLQLVRYKDNWKIDAWCHQKNALRTFSLEAINQAQLTEKPIKEVSQEKLKSHFESSYGIFAGQADKQAVIKFTPYMARWVQYEKWHPEQIGQWDIDGSYQLQIPYYKDQELLQDIIKYADHAEILAPPELRNKAKNLLQSALEKYK